MVHVLKGTETPSQMAFHMTNPTVYSSCVGPVPDSSNVTTDLVLLSIIE